MPKIIETDFSNKKVIKKTEINNDVNAPEEPLNDKEHGTFNSSKKVFGIEITRNFPEDYFRRDEEDGYCDCELTYSNDNYGKYDLTKGIEVDKDGNLILGGITYPTEFKNDAEFIEMQERSQYIVGCLKDASTLGYVLNAYDVIILNYCIFTPILGLYTHDIKHNFDTLFNIVRAQAHLLQMAGLIPGEPIKDQMPEKEDENSKE